MPVVGVGGVWAWVEHQTNHVHDPLGRVCGLGLWLWLVTGSTDWSSCYGVAGMWRLVLGMIVDWWILAYCWVLEQPLSSHCVWWCSSVKHFFLLALAAEL